MNEMVRTPYVGSAQRRVDGALKVTGGATYAAEFGADDLAHGYVVSSAIAKGKIATIDTAAALAVPGVVDVLTHENRPGAPFERESFQDAVAPPGVPFRPLESGRIVYAGQPVALVVAETFEAARHAASLVVISYDREAPVTDLAAARVDAYDPPEKRAGIAPPPKPWGNAEKALADAPIRIEQDYRIAIEHHQPMEMFASTVVWRGEGALTIHDKVQGVTNSKDYVVENFGLKAENVRVVSPFIGGAFGSGLRPQYQLFIAVLAALKLKRSVRVVLTRDQMFTFSYRPEVLQHVALGADAQGNLLAMRHDAIGATSMFEDYQEVVVNWTGLLYSCENVALTYKLAKLDTYTPADMRARQPTCARRVRSPAFSRSRSRWTSLPTPPASIRSSCAYVTTPRPTRPRTSLTPRRSCAPAIARARKNSAGRVALRSRDRCAMAATSSVSAWRAACGKHR